MKEQKENKQQSNQFSTILEWHPVNELPKVKDGETCVDIIVMTKSKYGTNLFNTKFFITDKKITFCDYIVFAWSYTGNIFNDAQLAVQNSHFNSQWLEELRNNAFNL